MAKISDTCRRGDDGPLFRYDVEYSPTSWVGKVWNADGDLVGEPQITVTGAALPEPQLGNEVKNWICGAIRNRVGVE